jgi:5-methyltetrahydropteroyltriglutamate--homocysteine methyltransferase
MHAEPSIPTSLVGSYAQPDWLIDRDKLRGRFPPRVRARELWRIDPRYIEEAQDDATRLAILDQERAGLDVVTDGEMRRESYSNRFATALEGVDVDNPGTALDRSGHPNPVPRVVGPVARRHPVQVRDAEFLLAHTSRTTKMTVPGPFTMSQQAQDDYYGSPDAVGMAYADAVRGEIADLLAAGVDVVQVDEPYMQARPEAAREYGLDVLKRATDGIDGTLAVHICFGYAAIIHDRPSGYSFLPELAATECDQVSIETAQSGLALDVLDSLDAKTIILGVLDLSTDRVETPDTVAERIRRALPHADATRLVAAPDCGMKYLPRDAAYGKLEALVEGARLAASANGG